MTARKIKHERALAKREEFMKTVHQGNQNWLQKAQQDRIEEKKAAEKQAKDRKIAKSKKLAEAHRARPAAPIKKENKDA